MRVVHELSLQRSSAVAAVSLPQVSTPSSPFTLLTIVDASDSVHLANKLDSSQPAVVHRGWSASSNSSPSRTVPTFLSSPDSDGAITSASTPRLPDTAAAAAVAAAVAATVAAAQACCLVASITGGA